MFFFEMGTLEKRQLRRNALCYAKRRQSNSCRGEFNAANFLVTFSSGTTATRVKRGVLWGNFLQAKIS